MDAVDKNILGIIQSGFPIVSRPYEEIGKKVGCNEDEAFKRVNALREDGVIRRIGANFGSRELGWHSTLCAASVPEEKSTNSLPKLTVIVALLTTIFAKMISISGLLSSARTKRPCKPHSNP